MQTSRIKWSVKPEAYIVAATVLIALPIKWIVGWLLAVVVHEVFHYASLMLLRVRVYGIIVGVSGTYMETAPMDNLTEALCALAGPVGGFCLLFLSRWMPHVAICGLFQSLYNLIPIFPLDGGRVFVCLLRTFLTGESAALIYRCITMIFLLFFLAISVYALYIRLGFLPLVFTIVLFLKYKKENPLANNVK